mgnify:CR=1 FL=1
MRGSVHAIVVVPAREPLTGAEASMLPMRRRLQITGISCPGRPAGGAGPNCGRVGPVQAGKVHYGAAFEKRNCVHFGG